MAYPFGFGELLHGLLQVAEGPFHQALVLLEVVQQHIPQWLLRQDLRVAQNDYAILGSGQGYIQTPRVTEKPYALQVSWDISLADKASVAKGGYRLHDMKAGCGHCLPSWPIVHACCPCVCCSGVVLSLGPCAASDMSKDE